MFLRPAPFLVGLAVLQACSTSAQKDAAAVARADSIAQARLDSIARVRQDSINRAQPGYVVDSILPVEEEVRRFSAAIGGKPVTALAHGAASADALVQRFAQALAASDSIALRNMALSAREFIDLVYPSSPYTKPPYRQSPSLLWSQIRNPSSSGYRRLLERLGGKPLRIAAVTCPGAPERQGANLLHTKCTVRFTSGSDPERPGVLFGTILERGGQFKFVSFSNMY